LLLSCSNEAGLADTRRQVLFLRVEEIVGGIPHASFMAGLPSVAVGHGCFATFRVESLNGCDARKQAVAIVADDLDEQPGNRIGIG